MNIEKTEALWIGNWRNNMDRPKNLRWTSSMVKNLGVWVGNNRNEIAYVTFTEILEKIKKQIKVLGWQGYITKREN